MKKIILAFALLFVVQQNYAQSYKLGNVTNEELLEKVYSFHIFLLNNILR